MNKTRTICANSRQQQQRTSPIFNKVQRKTYDIKQNNKINRKKNNKPNRHQQKEQEEEVQSLGSSLSTEIGQTYQVYRKDSRLSLTKNFDKEFKDENKDKESENNENIANHHVCRKCKHHKAKHIVDVPRTIVLGPLVPKTKVTSLTKKVPRNPVRNTDEGDEGILVVPDNSTPPMSTIVRILKTNLNISPFVKKFLEQKLKQKLLLSSKQNFVENSEPAPPTTGDHSSKILDFCRQNSPRDKNESEIELDWLDCAEPENRRRTMVMGYLDDLEEVEEDDGGVAQQLTQFNHIDDKDEERKGKTRNLGQKTFRLGRRIQTQRSRTKQKNLVPNKSPVVDQEERKNVPMIKLDISSIKSIKTNQTFFLSTTKTTPKNTRKLKTLRNRPRTLNFGTRSTTTADYPKQHVRRISTTTTARTSKATTRNYRPIQLSPMQSNTNETTRARSRTLTKAKVKVKLDSGKDTNGSNDTKPWIENNTNTNNNKNGGNRLKIVLEIGTEDRIGDPAAEQRICCKRSKMSQLNRPCLRSHRQPERR